MVAYETQGSFSNEVLQLVSSCLVNNFDEKTWIEFVFKIQARYLEDPVSTRKVAVAELYNQTRVI